MPTGRGYDDLNRPGTLSPDPMESSSGEESEDWEVPIEVPVLSAHPWSLLKWRQPGHTYRK